MTEVGKDQSAGVDSGKILCAFLSDLKSKIYEKADLDPE